MNELKNILYAKLLGERKGKGKWCVAKYGGILGSVYQVYFQVYLVYTKYTSKYTPSIQVYQVYSKYTSKYTRNLSSAFNPSKCTLTAVNTHLEQWAAILQCPGSSWGIGALLKGLTSVVVLKVERALVIHSPHRQSLPDPATFGLQVQLSNH